MCPHWSLRPHCFNRLDMQLQASDNVGKWIDDSSIGWSCSVSWIWLCGQSNWWSFATWQKRRVRPADENWRYEPHVMRWLTLSRPSWELTLRIRLVVGARRNSGRSASMSILAPKKLVRSTVSACSTELVSTSLNDTPALFTCREIQQRSKRLRFRNQKTPSCQDRFSDTSHAACQHGIWILKRRFWGTFKLEKKNLHLYTVYVYVLWHQR